MVGIYTASIPRKSLAYSDMLILLSASDQVTAMPHELSVTSAIDQRSIEAMTLAGDFHALLVRLDDTHPGSNTAERVQSYQAQFDAIERLCAAPANWSLHPAAAPKAEHVLSARSGLTRLYLTGVPAPKMMLQEDGTLAAYWQRGENYASIDFDASGAYSWCAALGNDVIAGAWASGPLPEALRDVIAA